MNQGVKKELSWIALLASAAFLVRKKPGLAIGSAAVALGLRLSASQIYSLKNKSVVITGGSRGLGLALAKQFLQEGCRVTLLARDLPELEQAKKYLEKISGSQILIAVCDVTQKNQIQTAFMQVEQKFGRIDILVNNAGAITVGPFQSMDAADFDAQMNLHFHAVLNAITLALPFFQKIRGGRIVNISSLGGKIAVPHMAPYSASKFAIAGLSEVLSAELRKDNIFVTTVYPGLMRTGSHIQAVFKGDHEKEYAWFSLFGSTPGFSVDATYAAKKVVEAFKAGDSDLVISFPAKFAVLVHAIFPEIFSAVMNFTARLLPRGESHLRKTGAASDGWVRSHSWTSMLREIGHISEKKYNQKPLHNGEFNLGIRPDDETFH